MSFINFSKLNAQAKNAWKKDQLVIGTYNEGYVLGTNRLFLWMGEDHVPNKFLSIIAEYAGFIPDMNNKLYKIGKNIEWTQDVNLAAITGVDDLRRSRYLQKYIESPIKIKDTHELLLIQARDNLLIKGIRVELRDLIDSKDIDYEIETDPVGPLTAQSSGGLVFYQNGIAWIGFLADEPAKDLTKSIVNTLARTKITEVLK